MSNRHQQRIRERLQRQLEWLAEYDAQVKERGGEVLIYDRRPKDVFPVPVVDPPPDLAARARARVRSAEIRAGVRSYLATLTSPSPSDNPPVA